MVTIDKKFWLISKIKIVGPVKNIYPDNPNVYAYEAYFEATEYDDCRGHGLTPGQAVDNLLDCYGLDDDPLEMILIVGMIALSSIHCNNT